MREWPLRPFARFVYLAPAFPPVGKQSPIAPPRSLSPRITTSDDLPSRLASSARSSNAAYFAEQSCSGSIARCTAGVSVLAMPSPTAIAIPVATIIVANAPTLHSVRVRIALKRGRSVRALPSSLIHCGPIRPASSPVLTRTFLLMTSAPAPRHSPPSAPAPTRQGAAQEPHRQHAARHTQPAAGAAERRQPEEAAHTQPAAEQRPEAVRQQPASVRPRPSCCPS